MSATALAPARYRTRRVEKRDRVDAPHTRMPHARAVVADVLATAKAQRWDPDRGRARPAGRPKPRAGTPRCWPPAASAQAFPPGRPSMSGTRPPFHPPAAATTSFLRDAGWGAGRRRT